MPVWSRRIIDTHVHVYELGEGPGRRQDPAARQRVAASAPLGWLLEDMAGAGIDAAVLVQHSAFGPDNTYLAECVAAHPQLLRGIGLLDPTDRGAPAALQAWRARGLSGFRFHPLYFEDPGWLDGPGSDALWDAADECGAILQYHLLPRHCSALGRVARRHPEVRVIVDHLAKPDVSEDPPYRSYADVLALTELPLVWVKLGDYEKASHQGYPWRDTFPFVELLRERFGAGRLLWGTGFPGAARRVPLDQALAYVATELPLQPAERTAIFWDSPAALFGFA